MDIKSKKWKSVVSAVAFFLGVSLILGSLAQLGKVIGHHGYYVGAPDELLLGDYEGTQEFRDFVSNRLEDFLTMAVNGPLGYYYNSEYEDLYEAYAEEMQNRAEEAIEQVESDMQIAEEQGRTYAWPDYAYQGNWLGYANPYDFLYLEDMNEEDRRKFEEMNKKTAEQFHKSIEMDKNILYNVSRDGELLYTNAEGTGLPQQFESESAVDWLKSIPEGYNFMLYFDGSQVFILKDGAFTDIYGDGIYGESSDWYVPGYRNFTVSDSYAGVRICMAVLAEPVMYNYANGNSGYRQYSNDLYWMQYHMKEVSGGLDGVKRCLGAGIVFMIIYLLLRKHKSPVDRLLARGTGKLWIELKVLLLTGVCVLTGFIGLAAYYELSQVFSDMSYYDSLWDFRSYGSRILFSEMNPAAVVLLFWAFWLFVNDLRKNRREWKHGLCYRVYFALCVRELDGPASKKMVRRGGLVFVISTAALTVLAILAACVWIAADGPVMGMLLIVLVFAMAFAVQLAYQRRLKATAQDIELMSHRVSQIRSGNYKSGGEQPEDEDFNAIFAGLEEIQSGMAQAVDEQMKSERMKVELIANVSHDIKTPLTSIISYVELLKQEQELPDYVKDYIHILDDKSNRLKNMIQDVFVVSKAASGELPVNLEILDFAKLLRQTLADMDEQIRNSRLTLKAEIPQEAVMIKADGQRLYRVFQNLLLNAMKYSLEGSRVYINLKQDSSTAFASVKNISRNELNGVTDFTERFVRGDESRTDGGSGLGLSIARSFTEACGGSFKLETIADLFVVTVSFRIADETEVAEARRELAQQEAAEAQGNPEAKTAY